MPLPQSLIASAGKAVVSADNWLRERESSSPEFLLDVREILIRQVPHVASHHTASHFVAIGISDVPGPEAWVDEAARSGSAGNPSARSGVWPRFHRTPSPFSRRTPGSGRNRRACHRTSRAL